MKKIFENLPASELVGSIHCTQDVIELYQMGLERRNMFLTICTQNELARRGEYDKIHEILIGFIEGGKMELGSDFTHFLSESLLEFRDADPCLAHLGKKIKIESSRKTEGVFSVDNPEEVFVDTDDLSRAYSFLERLAENGYGEDDISKMVQNFFNNRRIVKLEGIS
jgi:hypothetical protein